MSRSKNLEPSDYLLIWELICKGITDDFRLCEQYKKLTGRGVSVESVKKMRKFFEFRALFSFHNDARNGILV